MNNTIRYRTILVIILLMLSSLILPPGLNPSPSVRAGDGYGGRFAGGSGTTADPYQITLIDHLYKIRYNLSLNFTLLNDLDFNDNDSYSNPAVSKTSNTTGAGWTPIYNYSASFPLNGFCGVINGNNHTISNLFIYSYSQVGIGIGLLAYSDGTVKYLGLINPKITGTARAVGSLLGNMDDNNGDDCVVLYCYARNVNITGGNFVGGLIGQMYVHGDRSVECSYTTGTVVGGSGVGGLIGYSYSNYHHPPGYTLDSYSTANVTGEDSVGGLIGYVASGPVINYCYASGIVTGGINVGGLVGKLTTISDYSHADYSYSTGLVTGASSLGGLVGYKEGGSAWYSMYDNQTSGQTTSALGTGANTSSMKKNSTYSQYFDIRKIEVWNGQKWYIVEGKDYPRLYWQMPKNPLSFKANTSISKTINLTWNMGNNTEKTYIRYKTGATAPTSLTDGTFLYNDTGTSTSATGLLKNTQYSFKAWGWDEDTRQYSFLNSTATNTTFPNNAPTYGTPSPTNQSTNQSSSFTWSIPITDADNDTINWTIQCDNGQTNSANGAYSGTKSLSLTGLTYNHQYKIWVNATDGTATTRAWYLFTTSYTLQGNIMGTLYGEAGVTVTATNGSHSYSDITDGFGDYIITGLELDTYYNVTPTKTAYSFTPTTRTVYVNGTSTDMNFTASPSFEGGDGNTLTPFRISTTTQLNLVRYFANYSFAVINDINMDDENIKTWNSGKGFIPIGNQTVPFTGVFDGAAFTISNQYTNTTLPYAGLFGLTQNATIRYTGLSSPNITGGNYTGSLIGYADNTSVDQCFITNHNNTTPLITGNKYTGGLIGEIKQGYINDSYARVKTTGAVGKTGGLIGLNQASTIQYTYSTGDSPEGICGVNNGTILDTYWDNESSGTTTSNGGIGKNTATMKNLSFWETTNFSFPDIWFYDESLNDMYPILSVYINITPPLLREITNAGSITQQNYRYFNSTFNPEDYCYFNITAYVPEERYTGRWNKNVSDKYLAATGESIGYLGGDNTVNNTIFASRFPSTYTGYYTQMRIFTIWHGHYPSHLGGAIYSDDGGVPGTLLGYTEAWTMPRGRDVIWFPDYAHEWITLNLSYPVYMVQETNYWLLLTSNDSSQWRESSYGGSNMTGMSDYAWALGDTVGDTDDVKMVQYNIPLTIPGKEFYDPYGGMYGPGYEYWRGDVFNATFTWDADMSSQPWEQGKDITGNTSLAQLLIYAVSDVAV
jgi:hypothetical protein